MNLKRVLSPGGRLYITIHDEHTIALLESTYKEHWFAQQMNQDTFFKQSKDNFGMLVFGRDAYSQVFYDIEYFCNILRSTGFNIISITQEAFAYQTAVLVERN